MFKKYWKNQNKKQVSKQTSKTEELTLFPLDKLEIIKVQNQKSIDKLNAKICELELVNEMINNYNKSENYDN